MFNYAKTAGMNGIEENEYEHEQEYLRIGTTYYRKIRKPLASGDFTELLLPWSIECIKQNYGKAFLSATTCSPTGKTICKRL
jgi:hypothetical protein